jgi:hypothetical protein
VSLNRKAVGCWIGFVKSKLISGRLSWNGQAPGIYRNGQAVHERLFTRWIGNKEAKYRRS